MTLDNYFENIKGKRVAVVGIGVSNRPLIDLLVSHGCDVTACDKRGYDALGMVGDELTAAGVKLKLGEDYLKDLDFDVIFRTPGLHPLFLKEAQEKGAFITSEMEAFFELCPCKIIAVTGSDGKTTTTTLISELLKAQGYTVHLGGNIGRPLLSDIPVMKSEDVAVLELSSFQLHSMKCAPDVAVVTNISPNHLDVHPDYKDYIDAKMSIFLGQKPDAKLVLNLDNELTVSFADKAPGKVEWFSRQKKVEAGCYCENGVVYREGRRLIDTKDILLPGVHNVENLMAACAATEGMVSDDVCRSVAETFGGVEHRIELVRTLRGVRYYNDSIASSPTRTIAGLRSFDKPVILIAGGHDKLVPFDPLAQEILKRVKRLYLTGETQEKIRDCVVSQPGYDPEKLEVNVIDDFREAVLAAADSAEDGDIVILSPACSSFDKFKNFVERGNTFRKIIEELE